MPQIIVYEVTTSVRPILVDVPEKTEDWDKLRWAINAVEKKEHLDKQKQLDEPHVSVGCGAAYYKEPKPDYFKQYFEMKR